MADIITNTLQIGSNNLILRDADAQEQISDLKDDFGDCFDTVPGRNLVNDADIANGYLNSSGTLVQYGDWKTTGYCDVKGISNIVCSASLVGDTSGRRYTTTLFFLCTYDANKNFIEQVDIGNSYTWAVDSGVSFVRFSFHSNERENIMLESGTIPTNTYVPYLSGLKLNNDCAPMIWRNIKWAAIGDSLTEINVRTTMHYHDYIALKTGIDVINMGVSGTGYKCTEDENKAFYQRILNVPTDADVVTIFGSGNDLNYSAMGFNTFAEALGAVTDSTTDTICGCINKTIDNLYSVLPAVPLAIVTPCPWQSYNPANIGNNMDLYAQAIVEICKRHGIPCLDLYHCSGLRPWDATFRQLCYSNDDGGGTHPDDRGHKILAPHFESLLETLIL